MWIEEIQMELTGTSLQNWQTSEAFREVLRRHAKFRKNPQVHTQVHTQVHEQTKEERQAGKPRIEKGVQIKKG